jgi:hypothetical protein
MEDIVCPSCGQKVSESLFSTPGKVLKFVLVMSLLAYISLSVLALVVTTPANLRRIKGAMPFDSWIQPLAASPLFQFLVAGGLLAGVLLFYIDAAWVKFERWKKKRNPKPDTELSARHYICRNCGCEWDQESTGQTG